MTRWKGGRFRNSNFRHLCGGASTTWIVFSVKTPSPLKSSTPKHHQYKKDKKSKMILNRIGRRQILLFLLASLSALLTLKNRDKASGSMRVRPPAASTKGWTCNLFFAANRKNFLMRQNSSWKLWKGKRPKLLNCPVHEDNLRITFTIFELFKGMFCLSLMDQGGAGQPFLFYGQGVHPCQLPSSPPPLPRTPPCWNTNLPWPGPPPLKTPPPSPPPPKRQKWKISNLWWSRGLTQWSNNVKF